MRKKVHYIKRHGNESSVNTYLLLPEYWRPVRFTAETLEFLDRSYNKVLL